MWRKKTSESCPRSISSMYSQNNSKKVVPNLSINTYVWWWLFGQWISAGSVCHILPEMGFNTVLLLLMSKHICHNQLLSIVHAFKKSDRWVKIFNSAESKKYVSSSLNAWKHAEFSNYLRLAHLIFWATTDLELQGRSFHRETDTCDQVPATE